jgi:hypothetical protein
VFKPTPKDEERLSVYDGDLISAEDSWRHFTEELQFSSVGVLAVTVRECTLQGLQAEPDPQPFPEHAVIRFDGCQKSQIAKKAKHLKQYAEKRGWQYRAESER